MLWQDVTLFHTCCYNVANPLGKISTLHKHTVTESESIGRIYSIF